jgi:hypothetical protein
VRWSRSSDLPALILSFDPRSDSFAVVAREHEPVVERDYISELVQALGRNPWRTAKELAASSEEGGIGARYDLVRNLLQDASSPFVSQPGKLVGRHPNAICWHIEQTIDQGVFPASGTDGTDHA